MTGGSSRRSRRAAEDELPGIVIGHDLAGALGAFVGDTVTLITPQGTLTPIGMTPRQRRFRVVGTFRLGLLEFDSAYGFVSLDAAQRLIGHEPASITSKLRVTDIYAAPAIADDDPARARAGLHDAATGPT